MPSLPQFQCLSCVCDSTTWPQALGSAHGVYFLASIPWGIQPQGWCPSRRGAGCHTATPQWALTDCAVPLLSGTASLLSKPGHTLHFCKTPYPWVSFCSAGKPLESRNPRMAGGNSWKMCQHCAAEQGGPSYLWTAGVQQEVFCHRMELSAGCKAFLGSSTNTQSIWVSLQSLQCQLCLQAGKKSCRWWSWSCLKMYNTQESGVGRKEPVLVKSEHVNSVASILSHLLCSPAL